MTVIYLRNSLDPERKVVPVTVSMDLVVDKQYHDGEHYWIIQFSTAAKDIYGQPIPAKVISVLPEEIDNIEETVQEGLSYIGSKVDWGTLDEDTINPYVSSYYPLNGSENVPIASNVSLTLRDEVPTSGIDPSSIKIKVNGIDITDKLKITNWFGKTKILWIPHRHYG